MPAGPLDITAAGRVALSTAPGPLALGRPGARGPAGYSVVSRELPVWMRADGTLWVATGDADLLRYLGAAPRRFDRMTAGEPRVYPRE